MSITKDLSIDSFYFSSKQLHFKFVSAISDSYKNRFFQLVCRSFITAVSRTIFLKIRGSQFKKFFLKLQCFELLANSYLWTISILYNIFYSFLFLHFDCLFFILVKLAVIRPALESSLCIFLLLFFSQRIHKTLYCTTATK